MPAAPRIDLFCPAKVNLALSVGAPEPALANMHPIASWMAAVNFGDDLTLERSRHGGSRFDIRFADDCPRSQQVDWPVEKDLCSRAHALLEQHVHRPLPVTLTLRKHVPAGAGMGGGSADAAFTLTGLNDLYDLRVSDDELQKLAGQLGSDIPFFIHVARGRTSAIVSHLGDRIDPLPPRPPLHLTLFFPPFGTPTGPVYRAFDQMLREGARADESRVRALAGNPGLRSEALFNDLAEPACRVVPELAQYRQKLAQALDVPVHITGSGSTLFALADDAAAATELARQAGELKIAARAVWTL